MRFAYNKGFGDGFNSVDTLYIHQDFEQWYTKWFERFKKK